MSEYTEHRAIATYIKSQFPEVIFTSDSSGLRLSRGNAMKMLALKSKHKIPDIIILAPKGHYHGLIIEMKKTGESPWKKDGNIRADKHVRAQADTLKRLNAQGYFACFGVGFEHTKKIIDKYMKKSKSKRI